MFLKSLILLRILFEMKNMPDIKNKKIVAWGANKMLDFYLRHTKNHRISYVIDSNPQLRGQRFCGLRVRSPREIERENLRETVFVIFAVSNIAVQEIMANLSASGLLFNKNVFLCSDLFFKTFSGKLNRAIKKRADRSNYDFVRSFALNAKVPIHTTFLGNLLFLELLAQVMKNNHYCVAEVGAYHGGNSLLALLYLTRYNSYSPFYILDSFDGFPEISRFDPQNKKRGDYKTEDTFENILNNFSIFDNARVIKGFVPETFSQLDHKNKYGLVFYDCDLYEPALATFEYFWDKIAPGGFLLIHDYVAEKGGYTGVKRATDEFFKTKKIAIHEFWENTMALIIKE